MGTGEHRDFRLPQYDPVYARHPSEGSVLDPVQLDWSLDIACWYICTTRRSLPAYHSFYSIVDLGCSPSELATPPRVCFRMGVQWVFFRHLALYLLPDSEIKANVREWVYSLRFLRGLSSYSLEMS